MSGVEIDANNNLLNVSYIQLNEQAEPANPADGQGRIYQKTGSSGLFWKPDSAGTEVDLSSGGGNNIISAAGTVSLISGGATSVIPASLNGTLLFGVGATADNCVLDDIDGDTNINSLTDCSSRISGLRASVVCAGQTATFSGTNITAITFYGELI